MISYDLDPSLHLGEPKPQLLEDGFSPRPVVGPDAAHDSLPKTSAEPAASAHWTKSEF